MELSSTSGFDFNLPKDRSSIIKVIGVGGAGNNALKHMYEKKIHGVDFVICNTDAQALDNNPVSNKVQLGPSITEGLGAGAEPEVGEKAAIESMDDIRAILGQNTKMVFITAGMGGGTGTGAAPVIAKAAKDMGILTVGIVTVPFAFEGKRRLEQAELGLEKLRESVDSLIVINNDNLRSIFGNLGFKQAFSKADEVLTNAAKGMAEVITAPFAINIDFRDAKTVLENSGTALMSTGIATGDNRAEEAVKKALDSPLLNDNKITGAKDVLLLILSGNEENQEATMDEIGFINDYVQKEAGGSNSANVIFGVGTEEDLGDAIKVLVIATGFAPEYEKKQTVTEVEPKPEKVTILLDEHTAHQSKIEEGVVTESPSQLMNVTKNIQKNDVETGKRVFHLEDDEDIKLNTPRNTFTVTQAEKVETPVLEEDRMSFSFENSGKEFIKEEESRSDYDLFSYNELEGVSYTFDLSTDEKEVSKNDFQNEEIKSQGFNFGNNRKDVETPVFVNQNQKEEVTEFKILTKEKPVASQNEEAIVEKKEEPIFEVEQKEEITIIEKKIAENPKVLERRNKLREFNSRYQANENENTFETIPAFKRRNVSLDLENTSGQNISSFYTERNGKVEMRENKYLNKDVD
jgi:hypothetical protein